MTTAILILLVAPVVGWALHRDIKRAIARRRARARLAELGKAFQGFQIAVANSLTPSLQKAARAAADAQKAFAQFGVSMKELSEASRRLQRPEDPR